MVLGPLLGAGASLAGALINSGHQETANHINWRAVLETIRANKKREQLERSSREDVYGNIIKYIPGQGWTFDLTPITQQIVNAEQVERRANLTEDAPRNRAAAVRMDERSKEADDLFQERFNEFKFRPEINEKAIQADTTQELLNARSRGLSEAANTLAQQLMRTGNSGNIAQVYKQAADTYAGSLEDAMLRGKRLGRQDAQNQESAQFGKFARELGLLGNVANTTTNTPVQFSNFNSELSGRADNALRGLSSTIGNNRDALSSALGRAAQGHANTRINLNGVASALAKLGAGGGSRRTRNREEEDPRDPWDGFRNVSNPWPDDNLWYTGI